VCRFVNPIEGTTKEPKRQALLKKQALDILNQNATFVQRNKARILRNIVDPIVRNKSTILKAAAAVAAVGATAYAVDRYGFEGKGLKYTQESASKGLKATKEAASNVYAKGQGYASWLYSKLPAKPTWLAMPAFVSNLFAKKAVETKVEDKSAETKTEQIAKTITDTIEQTSNTVKNLAKAGKENVQKLAQQKTSRKLDLSGSEMGF
jgi:ribosomal protein L17